MRRTLTILCYAGGLALVTWGAWWWYPPAGPLVLGLLLLLPIMFGDGGARAKPR